MFAKSGVPGIEVPVALALFGISPLAAVVLAKSFCTWMSKSCGESPASNDLSTFACNSEGIGCADPDDGMVEIERVSIVSGSALPEGGR